MKRALCAAVTVLTLGVAGSVLAATDNIGCGVGTMVFPDAELDDQAGARGDTNGCFGQPTSASPPHRRLREARLLASTPQLERFVASNMDALARDIAAGQGRPSRPSRALQVPAASGRRSSRPSRRTSAGSTSADVQAGQVIDAIIGVIS